MNLTPALEQTIINEYKSIENFKKILEELNLYQLQQFSTNQILKFFELENSNPFLESNAKKHLNKVQEMIFSHMSNSATKAYFSYFLYPTNNIKEYEKRKQAILNLNFEIEEEKLKEIKKLIKEIKPLSTKIYFKNNIITLSRKIEDLLFTKYKINSSFLNEKELEEYINYSDDPNTIIVHDEMVNVEIPQYSLKEFENLISGNIIKNNKQAIITLTKISNLTQELKENIQKTYIEFTKKNLYPTLDTEKLLEELEINPQEKIENLSEHILNLEEKAENLNEELKKILETKQVNLQGQELLDLLNSGNLEKLQQKLHEDTKEIIKKKENKLIEPLKQAKIFVTRIFENYSYPVKIDPEIKEELLNSLESKSADLENRYFENLGKHSLKEIKKLFQVAHFTDFVLTINQFTKKQNLEFPKISTTKTTLIKGRNIYIENATPISYGIGTDTCENQILENEKVSILTGANSGGKTTLLEMFLQSQILTSFGLGIPASNQSEIKFFDEIIYLKKFTGTQGSGAFEQTIRSLVEILDSQTSKFIFIDEFEAVTEPGAAAKILIMFLQQIQQQETLCIAVSHLGQEIQQFIKKQNITGIRIDGISATGLDEHGNLLTNHQPQFYTLGKSTPELILKRIIQDNKFWENKNNQTKEIFENLMK